MEFFQTLPNVSTRPDELKKLLTMTRLPALCASIDSVGCARDDGGEIYCLWGGFSVRREEILNGVRFSLLDCPHALAWSVTTDPEAGRLIVHCTIDKSEREADFVESIERFVRDWGDGLARSFA